MAGTPPAQAPASAAAARPPARAVARPRPPAARRRCRCPSRRRTRCPRRRPARRRARRRAPAGRRWRRSPCYARCRCRRPPRRRALQRRRRAPRGLCGRATRRPACAWGTGSRYRHRRPARRMGGTVSRGSVSGSPVMHPAALGTKHACAVKLSSGRARRLKAQLRSPADCLPVGRAGRPLAAAATCPGRTSPLQAAR